MVKIRRTIISEIYSTIQSTQFSLKDFDVELEDTSAFVHITFLPFPEYDFQITERDISSRNITNMLNPPPSEMRLFTVESPGEYKTTASRQGGDIHDCIGRIPGWCENIQEELSAPIPAPSIIDEFEEEIEERINERAGDSKERFSEDEVDSLKDKLDILTQKFVDLEENNKITEKELADIKSQVERMKDNLPVYPKSTWYKVSGHKILDLMKTVATSKEGRELFISSVKKLVEKL